MNEQLAIDTDTPGLARNDHPSTSHDAADSIDTGALRAKVYSYLIRRGQYGATDDEIIVAGELQGYSQNSLRPRRVELVKSHHVWDSGIKRLTRSKRSAIVWVADPYILDTPGL